MNLRKKTLLVMAAMLILVLAIGAFIVETIFLNSYRQLEQRDIQTDITRFDKALEYEMQRIGALTYDWAAWDDTYRFMQDKNTAYITSNLMVDTLQNLELNFMLFYSTSQTVHFFKATALEGDDYYLSVYELDEYFAENPELISLEKEPTAISGIIDVAGLPVLVASQPILTSQDEGPPMGRLVFGKILSGSLLEHLHLMTGEQISISPLDQAGLTSDQLEQLALLPPEEAVLIYTTPDDTIFAAAPIRDWSEQAIFILTVDKPREIFRQGRASMLRLGTAFLLAGLIGGSMALLFLEKGVISKLTRLNSALQNIRSLGYSDQSLVIPGDDEITSLSRELEDTLKELSHAHADVNNHLNFQRLLVKLSTTFINLPISQIDAHITKALKTIGELAGADRSYVFLRRVNEPHIVDNTHEWCRRGIQSVKSMLQGIEEPSLPWFFRRLRRGESILIPRVADLPDQAAAERELLQTQSIRSLAVVPLQAGGLLIGFVGYDAVRMETVFSEHSLALLGIVGSMLANAIDRQHKEEKLVHSQQIQYQLNKITRASIEKDGLRSTALTLSKELTELIHSDRGILVLFNSDGAPEIFDTGKQIRRSRINPQNWTDFLAHQQEFIYIHEDTLAEDTPEFIQHLGIQSCIAIPLVAEQDLLGIAILANHHARQFTYEEAAICQQAGPQITLAIMKVKALEAAHQRTRELNALRATIADITSELELKKLLRTMLERAVRLAHADGGEICVFHEDRQALMVVASHNLDKDYSGEWMSIGEGAGGKAVQLKRTFRVEDYAAWPGRMQAYQGIKFHATIVTPLMIGTRILGTISLLQFKPDRQFSEADQHILSLFAQHAAIAMENSMLFEKVHELARTDTVTGLLNRRALREIGDYEVARANRLGHPIAVAMIDLDDFKRINDTYSHQVGDEVLKEVARICRENIRNIDIISRYGGDEFVVIMPTTDQESALHVSRRLQKIMENNPIIVNGDTFIARFSMGLTVHTLNPPALDELFAQADEAMYAAKNSGKNRIRVYKHTGEPKP